MASKTTKKRYLKTFLGYLLWFFMAVSIAISIKIYFTELFCIESWSMNQTLKPGDVILCSKLHYGARVNGWDYLFGNEAWQYNRVKGLTYPKHNDIVLFNEPTANGDVPFKSVFVKRLAGLPGDTLEIKNTVICVNSVALPNPKNALYFYSNKSITSTTCLSGFYKTFRKYSGMDTIHGFEMTASACAMYNDTTLVDTMVRFSAPAGMYDESAFPHSHDYKWNIDNLGPVIVPAKGTNVNLTLENLPLYSDIIEKYEHNSMFIKDSLIYVNDSITDSYTFKMDYYYVVGDNSNCSIDSRYWGFVPEDHLIGKAVFILFSYDKGFKWNRFFEVL